MAPPVDPTPLAVLNPAMIWVGLLTVGVLVLAVWLVGGAVRETLRPPPRPILIGRSPRMTSAQIRTRRQK